MHRNTQNNYHRSYSYIPPSNSTSNRNIHYQHNDSPLPIRQSFDSNSTPIITYMSPPSQQQQQQQQTSTTISDLAEPLSIFDDLKFPSHHRSNTVHFPSIYVPSNSTRRTSASDTRFTTASIMRERLLNDIQHNISEIDQELSSLEHRPSILPRLLPIDKKPPSLYDENQMWSNRPKKFYEVVPRIKSESKIIPKHSTPILTNQTISPPFVGQFHYAPEIEEIEILETDPENSDRKSNLDQIPEFIVHETFSLDQFRREQSILQHDRALNFVPVYDDNNETGANETTEDSHQNNPIDTDTARLSTQSALSQNRALHFVPQYADNNEIQLNETTEDFHENNPIGTVIAQLSIINSSNNFESTHQLNIQNFELLIQTAPEPKIEIPPTSAVNPDECLDKTETDLINTIVSKPVKHSHLPIKNEEIHIPSQQAIINSKNNNAADKDFFFSDFENEGEREEDHISIDQSNFALPTGAEIIPDDNMSNTLLRQSEKSLLNPNSLQEEQQHLIIQNNNEPVKETENKKIDAKTTHVITSISTLPSKKKVSISIYNNTQTQSTTKKSNIKQDQPKKSKTIVNKNTIEQSREYVPTNFSIELHSVSTTLQQKTSSQNMNSTQQQSASLDRSPPKQSVTTYHICTTSTEQSENIFNNKEQTSPRSSTIPVPLSSPDINNIRPSVSRTTTPERRNSIPSIDRNLLLTSTDMINFDNPNTDHFQMNKERDTPARLVNFESLQKTQQYNHSNEIKLENQDQNPSFSSSIHKQKNHRLKSVSPRIIEIKKSEHDDLYLPSLSSRHGDVSNANITSVDREDTHRQVISPVHHYNQWKKPVSPSSEPKLIIDNQSRHSSPIEEELPSITTSQRRSKLSLIIRGPKPQQKNSIFDQSAQTHTLDFSSINNGKQPERDRHVLFSNDISQFQTEENNSVKHWRERINAILGKRRFPGDKYSNIKSRVNSFANFDYKSRKIIVPKKKLFTKISSDHQKPTKDNKLKNRTIQPKQQIPSVKGPTSQLFGRLVRIPNGRPKIFHESLNWNVESKIKSYSSENLHYKSRGTDVKIFNKKPKWHSESRLSDFIKFSPHRRILTQTISLQTILDGHEPNFYQPESETERKIFDINSNGQQSISKFQESFLSNSSFNSKRSNKLISNKKLAWKKKSQSKDLIRENIKYQPKKSTVRIFHQPKHWNNQSKKQIIHSLTWDIQAKVKYWSEIDVRQLTKKEALFTQYHNPKWNDIITDNNYPLLSLRQKDYAEENFNEKFNNETEEESPANRPKWNSVSKTRSDNLVYNPKVANSNSIRRGWDLDLRRKRVHKLPPLKRKRDHNETAELAVETPPSNDPIVIDYNYAPSMHDRTTSMDYATTSSRRSSRLLAPSRRVPDLQLFSETPRSQRPIQQEWYDELSKSRSTHRTNMGRTRNNSFQDSNGSVHQTNTPRDLFTLRSSTRNSQNSVVSGTLLDPSIRTNRATELRLSRDMEEHHQHSHDPGQSMPTEIRGFRLEGTQLTVPDNATIRPLSNVNYRVSERVKTRRIYPWSSLHQNGTSSRNSLLVPITEFRHPSFETSIIQVPQLIHEE